MSNFVTQKLANMLETLITSKTRIKLLTKFFLNGNYSAHLRGLETEFGESTNSIRLELNKFEEAGLLNSNTRGNKKLFKANTKHPLFKEIHNILLKHFGFDQIIENIIQKIGSLHKVFITGDFAKGNDSDIIDLIIVGDNIDKAYLLELVDKAEQYIKRKIRYILFTLKEFKAYFEKNHNDNMLILWEENK